MLHITYYVCPSYSGIVYFKQRYSVIVPIQIRFSTQKHFLSDSQQKEKSVQKQEWWLCCDPFQAKLQVIQRWVFNVILAAGRFAYLHLDMKRSQLAGATSIFSMFDLLQQAFNSLGWLILYTASRTTISHVATKIKEYNILSLCWDERGWCK